MLARMDLPADRRAKLVALVLAVLLPLPAADLPREELLGRFDPAQQAGFVRVDGFLLRRETAEAFTRMQAAARADGVRLTILSATRNFDAQKAIWERKWAALPATAGDAARARQILRYSSMPGTSRHHWGTDLDLNRLNAAWFRSGEGLRVHQWLQRHAARFGFCQPYGPKGPSRPAGYEEEPWHWSYLPLSREYLRQYLAQVGNQDLTGFSGSAAAAAVDAVGQYVKGIDPGCR